MTLNELRPGQTAKVLEVQGMDAVAVRLMEMGLTPGVELVFIDTALWGDPLEVELRGYRLSLRKTEAARVVVESLYPPANSSS